MKKGKFIVIIVLALIITRISLLFSPFIDVDETLFAIFARVWQHGGIPYADAVETKAMGIYYFYVLASWLSGSLPNINMTAVHLLSIVWTGLTAWVVGRIATRIANERAGLWAALLFVLFSSFFIPKIIGASMDLTLLLPCALAMDFLLHDRDDGTLWRSFLAGILVSAGIIIKYQAGIMLPVVLTYFWLLRFPPRKAFTHSFIFALGCIPLTALMFWQLYTLGALQDFIYWSFGGSFRYLASGKGTISIWRKLLSHVLPFIVSTFLIWALATKRFKEWWQLGRVRWQKNPAESGVWLWFFLSIIAVCAGGRFYAHYFLLLMPQLSILAALRLVSWDETSWNRYRKWVFLAIAAPFLVTMTLRWYPRPFYAQLHEEYIDDYKPYGEMLKSRTQPNDRILVWGYSPAVYWFAERLPATRYLWSDVLVGRVVGIQRDLEEKIDYSQFIHPEMWKMFFSDMDEHRPAYIIDMAPTGMHNYQHFPMQNYPDLMAYIFQNYVQEPDFMGAKLFRRKDLPAIP